MKIDLEEGELIEDDDLEKEPSDASETNGTSTKNLKRISGGTMQLNFMRRSLNKVTSTEQKKKPAVSDEKRVFPTVLRGDEEPVRGLDGIVREDRFTRIETLRSGHFSFNGQNPETERLTTRKRPLADIEEDDANENERRRPRNI